MESGRDVRTTDDPQITDAQRNYLQRFDDWLACPNPATLERRQNALDLVLLEAGIKPEAAPETLRKLGQMVDGLEQLVADLRALIARTEKSSPAIRNPQFRKHPSDMKT